MSSHFFCFALAHICWFVTRRTVFVHRNRSTFSIAYLMRMNTLICKWHTCAQQFMRYSRRFRERPKKTKRSTKESCISNIRRQGALFHICRNIFMWHLRSDEQQFELLALLVISSQKITRDSLITRLYCNQQDPFTSIRLHLNIVWFTSSIIGINRTTIIIIDSLPTAMLVHKICTIQEAV